MIEAIIHVLPLAVKLYWCLAAGSVVITLLPVPIPTAFRSAVRLSAARGKLWHNKPAALGPLQDWAVPQAWFAHFYLVGTICNLLLWLLLANLIVQGFRSPATQLAACTDLAAPLLALTLFQVHLVRRLLETVLVMVYPPSAVMHGMAYLFGLSYYVAVPLSLLPDTLLAAAAAQVRAFAQDPALVLPCLLHIGSCRAPSAATCAPEDLLHVVRQSHPVTWLGVLVFAAGNVLQLVSHVMLARLHRGHPSFAVSGGADSGSDKFYKIPRGGPFELVSCPHYLGEIVIYVGLALATGPSTNLLLINLWVVSNLVLAAGATQQWYVSHFPAYPKQRRALIPWVW